MGADLRLRGQEVSIRVTIDGVPIDEVSSNVTGFNDSTERKLDEQGFLGEPTNRYDYTVSGFAADIEFQVNKATWLNLETAIDAKGQRTQPGTVFNIIRLDQFANGQTAIITYNDVSWGNTSSSFVRQDFVKVKAQIKTGSKSSKLNAI